MRAVVATTSVCSIYIGFLFVFGVALKPIYFTDVIGFKIIVFEDTEDTLLVKC